MEKYIFYIFIFIFINIKKKRLRYSDVINYMQKIMHIREKKLDSYQVFALIIFCLICKE